MVSLSLYGMAHPPRSNPPLRSSSRPPSPCITPSTVTIVVVVSFTAAPFSMVVRRDLVSSTGFSQDLVDLTDRLRQALLRAHGGQQLLHGLDARELALDRHPGPAAAGLPARHPRGRRRALAVR